MDVPVPDADVQLDKIETQSAELCKDYNQLRKDFDAYKSAVDSLQKTKAACLKGIKHQKYAAKQIRPLLQKQRQRNKNEDLDRIERIERELKSRTKPLDDMLDLLPKDSSIYLKVILGEVNVTLLDPLERFAYKNNYEKFKLVVTGVIFCLACIVYVYGGQFRVLDSLLNFLLVWYYCTLTIREQILIQNGSKIRGWWITHHFVSTVCAGIALTWPDSPSYAAFREQLVLFNAYLSIASFAQFYYQTGLLYRLRALGERQTMDITVEGFATFMLRGLSSLLPFLLIAYFFQLYNAYVLFRLAALPTTMEWQVRALAFIFVVLFCGNVWTTGSVLSKKFFTEKKSNVIEKQSKSERYHEMSPKQDPANKGKAD